MKKKIIMDYAGTLYALTVYLYIYFNILYSSSRKRLFGTFFIIRQTTITKIKILVPLKTFSVSQNKCTTLQLTTTKFKLQHFTIKKELFL